jgi:bacillithiol biosynthesis cysteine-adding enzyme BshC
MAAREINYPEDRRAAMVQALRTQNGDSESLDKLAQPGTIAVVTGQQVGLFGGPAYTIYKALTAARLARNLSQRGIQAVPIFWLASEDHDFAEVSLTWSFNAALTPVRLHVDPAPEAIGRSRPVGGIQLLSLPTAELRRSLSEFLHGDEVIALTEKAYRPGVTMAEGFRALLQALLPDSGLLFLNPLASDIRTLAAPMLAEALSAAPELKSRLLQRNRELASAGYHAQVHLEPKTSLFFLLDGGERVTLRLKDSEFASLRDRAADISPTALLRPVMQDYLLPTVAYVGGPAELAYLAQSRVLYDCLLGRMPVVLSRCGFTLLNARAEKLLKRYRLRVTDTLTHEEALHERMAHALVPENVEDSFGAAASAVERELEGLGREIQAFDPTLGSALQKSRSKILYQLGKMRRKTARETMRRQAQAGADAEFLHNLIYPHRHLQERFYSILPFLAQHGLETIDRLFQATGQECPDHRILTL